MTTDIACASCRGGEFAEPPTIADRRLLDGWGWDQWQ